MAEEQELRITATLDDQASAGLGRLQANVRQLGTGPQAQAMESMRRQAREASQGISGLAQAASGLAQALPAVGVALAGMAGSFIASGIANYAENLTSLGRAARGVGEDLAQFRANIDVLRTAGISEEEAATQLRAFANFQVELAQKGSRAYQEIVAATGPVAGETMAAARRNMENFLNEIAILPSQEALERVRERAGEIYQEVLVFRTNEARARGASEEEAAAYGQRMAAEAARSWASQFGTPAVTEVTRAFAQVTEEERALWAVREADAARYQEALLGLKLAWADIKSTVGAIIIAPMTETISADMRDLRRIADLAREIEQLFRNPSEEFPRMMARIRDAASNLIPQSVRDFFENPSENLTQLMVRIREAARDLIPQPVLDFFASPGESLTGLMTRTREAARDLIPQSIVDFFEAPQEGILSLIARVREAVRDLIPQPVIDFFDAPGEGILALIDHIRNAALDLIPQSVIEFFERPGEGLLNLVNQIGERMRNLVPEGLRRWLPGGGGEAPAPAAAAAPQPIVVPSEVQSEHQPIIIPPHVQEQLQAAQEAGAAETPPPAPQRSAWDPRGWIGMQEGGTAETGRPYLVGERGPELMVPRGTGDVVSSEGIMEALTKHAPTAIWAASKLLEGQVPGISSVVHGASRGLGGASQGYGFGDIAHAAVVPGAGLLQTMKRDAEGGHSLRSSLRNLLGIEDPGEPAPWQRGGEFDYAQAAADLDRSAAQQVNVSGTGRISVDVRAPEGTRVNAEGEGLFKTTEIMRQTQMFPADYGPAAATGVNAGAGTLGTG